MVTCTTHWLSLALIVTFPNTTHITLHNPDQIRSFMESCGLDPDEDDPLDVDECPTSWSPYPIVEDIDYACDRGAVA